MYNPEMILEAKKWIGRKTRINQNQCWVFIGGLTSNGYGQIGRHTKIGSHFKVSSLHRLSYLVYFGEIKNGIHIHHECYNKACCNPEHLKPVTHQENLIDAYQNPQSPNLIPKSVIFRVKEMIKQRISYDEIGKQLGLTRGQVIHRAQYEKKKQTEHNKRLAVRMRRKGYKLKEIAEKIGISESGVSWLLKRQGVSSIYKKRNR